MPDISKSITEISKYIQVGIELNLITEKEIKQAEQEKEKQKLKEYQGRPEIQKILQYARQGMSENEISKMPDISKTQGFVASNIQKCIRLGIVTREEIEQAQEERRRGKTEKDIERVLEYKRRGISNTAISKMPDIHLPALTVARYEQKGIEKELITEEEIQQAKEERKRRKLQENLEFQKILGYKKQGMIDAQIKNMPDILKTQRTVSIYVQKGIELGLITEEEIEQAKEDRKQIEKKVLKKDKNKAKVFKCMEQGLIPIEIAIASNLTLDVVQSYIAEIQKDHNISNLVFNWKERQKANAVQKKAAILEGLEAGLTDKEIIEKYPKQKILGETIVEYYKTILIKEGTITEEEIMQYRKSRKEKKREIKSNHIVTNNRKKVLNLQEKITEEQKKQMKMFNNIKREVDEEVRLNKKISKEKEEKIRTYIDLCYQIYKKKKISKRELEFLKQAMKKIQIDHQDILKFVRICSNVEAYEEAYNIVRNRNEKAVIPEDKKEVFEKLENTLKNSCKIQKAITLIREGNNDTMAISEITGLSKDEINILKLKLSGKPITLSNISKREKVIELLLQYKNSKIIQQKLNISDFEMNDIEEQVIYRRIKQKEKNVSLEIEVKQDSNIRTEVLCLKLGKKPNSISKMLRLEDGEIEQHIKYALEFGLIKQNELKGINFLEYQVPKIEQLEL